MVQRLKRNWDNRYPLLPPGAAQDAICWFSCEQRTGRFSAGEAIAHLNPDVVIAQGDAPYVNRGWTAWGSTTAAVDKDSTAAGEFKDHYDQMEANPGWVAFLAHTFGKKFASFDDHEWGDDNWMHDITTNGGGISATTQAEVNTHWDEGRQAWETFVAANYDNGSLTRDGLTNTVVPTGALQEAQSPAASLYPVQYGRYTQGDIEVIMLDCISYRDISTSKPGAGKTLLGSQQLAWAKSKIAASTADFVVVASSKKAGGQGTGDNWSHYQAEFRDLVDNLGRTGVLFVTGDSHWPQVNIEPTAERATRQWSAVNACPSGVWWTPDLSGENGKPVNDTLAEIKWAAGSIRAGASAEERNMFGYCYINDGKLWAEIRDHTQKVHWQGYLTTDTNSITQTWGVG